MTGGSIFLAIVMVIGEIGIAGIATGQNGQNNDGQTSAKHEPSPLIPVSAVTGLKSFLVNAERDLRAFFSRKQGEKAIRDAGKRIKIVEKIFPFSCEWGDIPLFQSRSVFKVFILLEYLLIVDVPGDHLPTGEGELPFGRYLVQALRLGARGTSGQNGQGERCEKNPTHKPSPLIPISAVTGLKGFLVHTEKILNINFY
jgi:hypothetical protein